MFCKLLGVVQVFEMIGKGAVLLDRTVYIDKGLTILNTQQF